MPALPPFGPLTVGSFRQGGPALSDGYYAYIDQGPKPSIAVIQDLDGNNGYGCLWGE